MSRCQTLVLDGTHSALLARGPVELYSITLALNGNPPENAYTLILSNNVKASEITADDVVIQINKADQLLQGVPLVQMNFDGIMFPQGMFISVGGTAGDELQCFIEYE